MPTLRHLLAYPDPPNRRIRKLSISADSADYGRSVNIFLGGDPQDHLFLMFSGRGDRQTIKLIEEVEEHISSMKPWYAMVARIDLFQMALLLILMAWLVAWIASFFIKTSDSHSPLGALGLAIVLGIFALPLVAGYLLNRLKDWAFPKGAFLLGQEVKRYQNMEIVRQGIILCFVISLLSSLVVAFLTAHKEAATPR